MGRQASGMHGACILATPWALCTWLGACADALGDRLGDAVGCALLEDGNTVGEPEGDEDDEPPLGLDAAWPEGLALGLDEGVCVVPCCMGVGVAGVTPEDAPVLGETVGVTLEATFCGWVAGAAALRLPFAGLALPAARRTSQHLQPERLRVDRAHVLVPTWRARMECLQNGR